MNSALEIEVPLRMPPNDPLSRAAFWRLAEANPDLRMELEANGDLRIMTPTKRNTGSRNSYITAMLANWTYGDRRGDCFDSNTAFDLPDGSVLSPDASWVSFPRLKAAGSDDEHNPMCPEFLIELRSDSDRLPSLRKKMQLWLANGCELGWLIDPERKVVEIYRQGCEPEILQGHTAVYGGGPVGGFVLELSRIWS